MAKASDLLLRFDHLKHAALLAALQEHAITFGGAELRINQDDLVAIEIEATSGNAAGDSANIAKSILNNFHKDKKTGVEVVLYCVMPKMFKRAKDVLAKELGAERVYLIDVLKLLDELRKEYANG